MKKISLLLAVCLLTGIFNLKAQLYYSFNYNQSTYNELSNPVILDTTGYGIGYDWAIPIGFTFNELGFSWDTIGIYEYGVVGFGDDDGVINVAAFYYVIGDKDGLYLNPQLSYISYKTEGNPGSKILKIQWKNFGMRDFNNNYQTTSDDTINFQIWLYEGTDCIEIHIGNCNVIHTDLYKNGAMFSNETGPYIAIDFEGVPYYPTYVEGNPNNPTVSADPYNDTLMSLTSTPPVGMIYAFCPNATLIFEKFEEVKLSVFPNPATNNITTNTEKQGMLYIYNNEGTLLLEKTVNKGNTDVNISNLSKGIYLVNFITTEGRFASRKIIKE